MAIVKALKLNCGSLYIEHLRLLLLIHAQGALSPGLLEADPSCKCFAGAISFLPRLT